MIQGFGEKLIDFEWNSFPFDYDEFKSSVYCERLRYYFGMIQPGMMCDSFIHGLSHAERVALYCAVIAWKRSIQRKGGRLIYEYLLDRDVEPERIINVENLELSMAVPVGTKEYFEKMFQIV